MIPSAYKGKYSSGRFTKGYKGGRLSTAIDSRPPSEAYKANAARMGWDRLQTFCPTCDLLPSWCQCKAATKQQETHG
jgi:hypothetical protein